MRLDKDIIKDCLEGQQAAFKLLYERYVGYIYTICVRYRLNENDIKDQMQIIFSEAFHALKKFNHEKASFKTWLSRICINQILLTKRTSYYKQNIVDITPEEYNLTKDDGSLAIHKLDLEVLLQTLSQMPHQYIDVFNLSIMEGYSHEEIAEKLSISKSSSRVILNRARKWARKTIIKQHSA